MKEVMNMLLNYTVKGYKVFYDEVSFSMLADNYIKKNQENLITINDGKNKVVKSSFIYGPNNTGKTCFLNSLQFIVNLLQNKNLEIGSFDKNIFYKKEMPMKFSFLFSNNRDLYYYEIEFLENIAINEIFKKNNKIILNRSDKKNIVMNKIKEFIGERNNELMIYYLPKDYNDDLKAFTDFLNSFLFITSNSSFNIDNMLDDGCFNEINKLITKLDLHIDTLIDNRAQVEEVKKSNDLKGIDDYTLNRLKVLTKYKFRDQSIALPFALLDSNGTVRSTQLIYTLLNAIKNNKIIVVDEIERSLHSIMTKSIVSFYNSHDNKLSQLIATSHDLLLLDDKYLLRKDQIWFIHKDENNNYLYCLNDFKDNKDNDPRGNIMIKYLKGMFGALPNPDWF